MPDAEYVHDVFISFASTDAAWAERLHTDLSNKGLKVFLDRITIRDGETWDTQLVAALNESRHLVLLSSPATERSAWVSHEVGRFAQIVDPDGDGLTDRLMLQVLLDGSGNAVLNRRTQMIASIKAAGAYQAGPDALDEKVWRDVVDRVSNAVHHVDGSLAVPVLIVSTTAAQLKALDPELSVLGTPSLRSLLPELGLTTNDELAGFYGDSVRRWRPFCGERDIEALLVTMGDEINAVLRAGGGTPFRWELLDEDFWSLDDARIGNAVGRLAAGPSLIVVDAFALYDADIRTQFLGELGPAYENPQALFVMPSPSAMPPVTEQIRRVVNRLGKPMFVHSFDPPMLKAAYARCRLGTPDQAELKGWVMTTLGPRLRPRRVADVEFLRP